MFVGHLGAGLAAKAVERRVNLGILFGAAMLLDIALWAFVLLGWEHAIIPADFAQRHYLLFDFPLSHSLLAALIWSAAAALFWAVLWDRRRFLSIAAIVVALTALSHWVLDALVHEPELTLWGDTSPRIGFGLWDHQPGALLLEGAIAAIGLALFLARTAMAAWRKIVIVALTLLVAGLTYVGTTAATAPPNATAPAATSLAAIVVIVLLSAWADHARMPAQQRQAA